MVDAADAAVLSALAGEEGSGDMTDEQIVRWAMDKAGSARADTELVGSESDGEYANLSMPAILRDDMGDSGGGGRGAGSGGGSRFKGGGDDDSGSLTCTSSGASDDDDDDDDGGSGDRGGGEAGGEAAAALAFAARKQSTDGSSTLGAVGGEFSAGVLAQEGAVVAAMAATAAAAAPAPVPAAVPAAVPPAAATATIAGAGAAAAGSDALATLRLLGVDEAVQWVQAALAQRGIAVGRVAAALGALYEHGIDGAVLADLEAPELSDLGMAAPEAEALAASIAETAQGGRGAHVAAPPEGGGGGDSDSDSSDGEMDDGGPPSIAALQAAADDDDDSESESEGSDCDAGAAAKPRAPQRKLSAFAAEI